MGPGKSATKAEQARYTALKQLGCAACRQYGKARPAEVHHLVEAGERLGNDFTIPLCDWHHRGVVVRTSANYMTLLCGPSLARSRRDFEREFGTEHDILDDTNELLRDRRNFRFEQEVFA